MFRKLPEKGNGGVGEKKRWKRYLDLCWLYLQVVEVSDHGIEKLLVRF